MKTKIETKPSKSSVKAMLTFVIASFMFITPNALAVDEVHENGRIYVYTEKGTYVGSVAEGDKKGRKKLRKKADKLEENGQ